MPTDTSARQGQPTRLNQLVAVRDGARSAAEKARDKAHHLIQRAEPLGGIRRTHQSLIDGEPNEPTEYKHVQVLAEDVAADFGKAMSRLFDVTAAVDYTNTQAFADVVLPDGTVLIERAPVPYLIFLEKQLKDVRTFIEKLPVLDPAIEWTPPTAPGQPWTSVAVETKSTKKVPKNHVLAEATERHPAQVSVFQDDVRTGTWTTVKLSGAVPAARVAELRSRIAELIDAVKIAREAANLTAVIDPKPGARVFAYLFAPSR